MVKYDGRDYGLRVSHTSGDEQICYCPFHDDTTASAAFNTRKAIFYCFACHEGMSLAQLLDRLELSYDDVDEYAPEDGYFEVDLFKGIEDKAYTVVTTDEMPVEHATYLRGRDFDLLKTLALLKPVGFHFVLKPYLAIGFMQYNDDPTDNYQLRKLELKENESWPKYFFNGERAPYWPFEHILIGGRHIPIFFEGSFSAAKARMWGDTLLQPFSMQGSNWHEDLLKIAPKNSVFILDKDEAGKRAANKLKKLGYLSFIASSPIDDMDRTAYMKWERNAYERLKEFKL